MVIQFKRIFNSIVRESLVLFEAKKVPKKVSKIDKKGALYQKLKVSINI